MLLDPLQQEIIEQTLLHPESFPRLDLSLRNDRAFILELYKRTNPISRSKFQLTENLGNDLLEDHDFLLMLLEYDIQIIHLFPPNFLNEYFFMESAVMYNGFALLYASDALKQEEALAQKAVMNNGFILQDPSFQHYLEDETYAKSAVLSNPNIFPYVPAAFKADKSFLICVLKYTKIYLGTLLEELSTEILYDQDLILAAAKHNFDLVLSALTNKPDYFSNRDFQLDLLVEIPDKRQDIIATLIAHDYYNTRELPIDMQTELETRMSILKK